MTFPQLTSGALVQFPVTRRDERRTVLTRGADGSSLRLADDTATAVEWTLGFQGLSNAEWKALESFFLAAEGQLERFTFIDPLGNMLAWSVDLTEGVWQSDPGLILSGGVEDAFGTLEGTRVTNNAQAVQMISQSVSAPGSYQYSFSVYAAAPVREKITLVQKSGLLVSRVSHEVTTEWKRYTASARLDSFADEVTFGVELEPGATVVLAAVQAEPQPQSGIYHPTRSESSVYPGARFLDDAFEAVATSSEQISCSVRLRSAGGN